VNELVTRMHADLDVVAQEGIPARIMTAAAASLSHALGRLDAMLIAPLGHRASGAPPGRLVIIPTGGLLTLPWTMLPSLRFIPVEVAPSATAWLHATPAGPAPGQVAVSLLAGPGLPRAEDEVAAIARVWPEATTLMGAAAGPGALRTALAAADVVHVAAHGEHQSESPMFSSLQLGGGPVFAYELDRTARTAGHVILSACDVGLTTIRAGEESLGLTSALLHLGIRCVVAGVARVNDETAGTVMVDYHRRLARGVDSASALAQACAGSGPRPAPFVSFGAAWSAVPAG
jgi:hypothetical protein